MHAHLLVAGLLVAGCWPAGLPACWMPFWSSLKGSPGPALKSSRVTFFHYFFCIGLGTLKIIILAPKGYPNGVILRSFLVTF